MYCRSLKHTPGNFRIETTFNPRVGVIKFALNFPVLRIILSELLVRQGKIFFALTKLIRRSLSNIGLKASKLET